MWQELIQAFQTRHPEITVKQEYVVGWYGLYDRKLRQQCLAKSEPHVALVQASSFLTLAQQFRKLPVDGQLPFDNLNDSAMAIYRVAGIPKAMPVTGGNLLVYYNKNCFAKAADFHGTDIPFPQANWTMDNFAATARQLTCDFDGDSRTDQFGFWQPRWVYYQPFLWSFGADVLDDTGTKWSLTTESAAVALEFYREMRCGPDRYVPLPHETSQIIQDVAFLTGQTAMCVNGPWFIPLLEASKRAGDYGVANIPIGNAGRLTRVTWDGIAISKRISSSSLSSAIAFLQFVASDEGQHILTRTGRALPATHSAREALRNSKQRDTIQMFIDALDYSRTEPQTPLFRQLDLAINRHLVQYLQDNVDMEATEFLNTLANDPAILSLTEISR